MKLSKILTPLALLWVLTACAGSIGLDDLAALDIPPAPPAAFEACADPVKLPDRALSQSEVEAAWLTDRLALLTCGDLLGVVSEYAVGFPAALIQAFNNE
ncbi:MAG: hypothetical protein COB08_016815 [Rhodobacteraceae bacterium]|nr:hypothetical protein [Paracoccaceae bacterium]